MGVELAVEDMDDALAESQFERQPIEGGSAQSHVARDVDRPTLAPAQGLLEIHARDDALLQPQRRRTAEVVDGLGRRVSCGSKGEFGGALPLGARSAEIGEGRAKVGVLQLCARFDLQAPLPAREAEFALEPSAVRRGVEEANRQDAVLQDRRGGRFGELAAVEIDTRRRNAQVDVKAQRQRDRERLVAP